MSVIQLSEWGIDRVVSALQRYFSSGEPAILPTDTLYGIGAKASDHASIERIFAIKNRPLSQTLPVAVGDMEMLLRVASVEGWRLQYIEERLPGPYTFVLPARGIDDPLLVRNGTVAVRIPEHPLFAPLTGEVGPIALTSANPHGGSEIMKADEMERLYGGALLIVGDDMALSGRGSEIVDLTGDVPGLIRSGSLNKRSALEGNDG